MICKLIIGDSLEVMAGMESESVDLVVTSPPYANQRKQQYGGVHPDEYVDWFLPFAVEIKRLLKPSGSFVLNIKEHCNAGQRSTYVLKLVLALNEEVGLLWPEELIWHKTNPYPGEYKGRFRDGWEHLYHFTISKDFYNDKDACRVPVKPNSLGKEVQKEGRSITGSGFGTERKERKKTSPWKDTGTGSIYRPGFNYADKSKLPRRLSANGSEFDYGAVRYKVDDTCYPTNVLSLATVPNGRIRHSAQYPLAIPDFFVRFLSPPGGLVLDPFVGSCTTMQAAVNHGRDTIGIDRDPVCRHWAWQRLGLFVDVEGMESESEGVLESEGGEVMTGTDVCR